MLSQVCCDKLCVYSGIHRASTITVIQRDTLKNTRYSKLKSKNNIQITHSQAGQRNKEIKTEQIKNKNLNGKINP